MNMTNDDVLQCIGLAYTHEVNKNKVVDVDLAQSIKEELLKLLNK